MNQNPSRWAADVLSRATEFSNKTIENLLKLAADIKEDVRKDERHAAQKCKACFYRTTIAGQAITMRPCACCKSEQTYGSTSTNMLCKPCAEKHHLCAHCGADVELNIHRRKWISAD